MQMFAPTTIHGKRLEVHGRGKSQEGDHSPCGNAAKRLFAGCPGCSVWLYCHPWPAAEEPTQKGPFQHRRSHDRASHKHRRGGSSIFSTVQSIFQAYNTITCACPDSPGALGHACCSMGAPHQMPSGSWGAPCCSSVWPEAAAAHRREEEQQGKSRGQSDVHTKTYL